MKREMELASREFRASISEEENKLIRTTSLEDVRISLETLERELAARTSLQNFARLRPYLESVSQYSQAIDVLANGTPFLPYIWAPLKFILKSVLEHSRALEKVVEAFERISMCMSRIDQLGQLVETYGNSPHFRRLLVTLYTDIVKFNWFAYELACQRGWKQFINCQFGRFDRRFESILQSITATLECIERDAGVINIARAEKARRDIWEGLQAEERKWEQEQLDRVLAWLKESRNEQGSELQWLLEQCHDGTASWLIGNEKMKTFFRGEEGPSLIWMQGQLGTGKSVFSAQIVNYLRNLRPMHPVLYFFCRNYADLRTIKQVMLQAFTAQVVTLAPCSRVAAFLYHEYYAPKKELTSQLLREILWQILPTFERVSIVIDGLDEVPDVPGNEHRSLIDLILSMRAIDGANVKVLLSSQDIPSIRRCVVHAANMQPNLVRELPLDEERQNIKSAIGALVAVELQNILVGMEIPSGQKALLKTTRDRILRRIIDRASGMFLWVRLVLSLLENSAATLEELEHSVDTLPLELEKAYDKILRKISSRCELPKSQQILRRIFSWLLFSNARPFVRKFELLNGAAFGDDIDTLTAKTMVLPRTLQNCKPLVQDGPMGTGTIVFIHSTVSKYLRKKSSVLYLAPQVGHRNIALSCMSHMSQALELIDPRVSDLERRRRTVQGFYGLHHYASRYWIDHFLEFCQLTPSLHDGDCLIQRANSLVTRHNGILESLDAPLLQQPGLEECAALDPRLCQAGIPQGLQTLAFHVLEYRKWLMDQQSTKPLSNWAEERTDPTLFYPTSTQYNQNVALLVAETTRPAAECSVEEQDKFREGFGDTAFPCPMTKCDRSLLGFASAHEVELHVERAHSNLRWCTDPGCIYGKHIGFQTEKLLKAHLRTHSKPRLRRVPASIGRNRQSGNGRLIFGQSSHSRVPPSSEMESSGTSPPSGETTLISVPVDQGSNGVESGQTDNDPFYDPIKHAASPLPEDTVLDSLPAQVGSPFFDGGILENEETALLRAIKKCDIPAARDCLESNPGDLDTPDSDGHTPLHAAALTGNASIVQLILGQGPNLECQDRTGKTPLLDAIARMDLEVVRLLLRAGVNPYHRNPKGENPAKWTQSSYGADAVEIGRELTDARSRWRRSQRCRSQSDDGSSTSCFSTDAESPRVPSGQDPPQGIPEADALVEAARNGLEHSVQILIDCGLDADPHTVPVGNKSDEQISPILAAIGGPQSIGVIKLLLQQPAFNACRKVNGQHYHEIAKERKGECWEEEEMLLKEAYRARNSQRKRRLEQQDSDRAARRRRVGRNASQTGGIK